MATKLRVDVWFDIACPWCWIGKRRLEAALDRAGEREATDVVWRSFELVPSAPLGSVRAPAAEARARLDRVRAIAAAEGLDVRFDRVQPGYLFDAHRVVHLAGDRGLQSAVVERFFRAHLSEGARMSDHDTLVALGVECGLDAEEIRTTLAGDVYDDDVREDEMEAAELGIRGVPFFVLGGRTTIAGAQGVSVLAAGLAEARRVVEASALPAVTPPPRAHATAPRPS